MTQERRLPHSAPEAQGIPSAAIDAFVDAAGRDVQYLHSLTLLRHGHVVAEGWWDPYGPRTPHLLFSLSKSFTSTAIGLLVAEGRLTVDDHVLGFFPDAVPAEPGAHLRDMRVRHLLSMSTGHDEDPTRTVFGSPDGDWPRAFLSLPVEHEPGTHFAYNTAATFMLSAIAQRLTGMRLVHYLESRLFEPLGIAPPTWETSPQGIDVGGSGLSLTTGDIACFGQLYLQRGTWQGRQIVPEAWVAEATSCHVSNGPSANPDWEQGYGYQFWRCRHGAYRGDGAFGQYCVVMPAQDAVLAITSGVGTMQHVLDLVWEHLLPAMGSEPLLGDRAASKALAERLARLHLAPQEGRNESATAPRISRRAFTLSPNDEKVESLAFDFGSDGCTIAIHNDRGEQRIPCGYGAWSRGEAAVERTVPWKVAASAAWTDDQTFVVQLWWYETPFRRTLTCRFDGDRVAVEQQLNVAMGPTERPRLEGRLV